MGNQPARRKRAKHDGELTRFYETLTIQTRPTRSTGLGRTHKLSLVNEKAIDVT